MQLLRSPELRQPRMARPLAAMALVFGVALAPAGLAGTANTVSVGAAHAASSTVSVLFAAVNGSDSVARALVEEAGGRVTRSLQIIDAHAATMPRARIDEVFRHSAFAWVAPDRAVSLSHTSTTDPAVGVTSMFHIAQTVRANRLWDDGINGSGVDVAVIDSGVVPVNGLSTPGKVVNGPDLSFESGSDDLRYLDTFGHGTHMAGIIAGRDDGVAVGEPASHDRFTGIAPGSRVVNIKVANSSGATDVSQVIAAIDWVVQHGRSNGLNIRVLNLSFGTDGVQDYRFDPLAHAVEQAWHRGLVVVTAAGNEGHGNAKMNNPAYDPYVIAVGGSDSVGTTAGDDDVVASWSSRGDAARRPDVVAPGQSVVSLRDPGSMIDVEYPGARVGERFFRGSGTSQAAAVVSGSAALLLQHRPHLTPDQVKSLLMSTARPLAGAVAGQGSGLIDLKAAAATSAPSSVQSWPRSFGTGSLEAARGTHHVSINGVMLVGELSVFLTLWDSYAWATDASSAVTWEGGSWSGNSWTGNSWTGGSWTGNSWTGNSWTGNSWTGNSWTGNSWTGNSWTGNSWTGNSWTSAYW